MSDIVKSIKSKKPESRIITLGDTSAISRVTEFISTQCPPLDLILGGGVPVGRITEIYGDTSTGKTLLALHLLAECQAAGGTAVMLDTEAAVGHDVATLVGVDIDDLIYTNPDTVEEVFDDIQDVLEAKKDADPDGLMIIVWDSVAATSSDEEVEKVMKEGLGSRTIATHARLISKMMRVLKRIIASERVALVLLNQTRDKIGVLYGDKKSTFGGRAIGYYSSIRLELALRNKIKDKGDIVGINARAYVAKSKVAPPFGECVVPILFDVGIDEAMSVLDWLKSEKLAVTRGSWTYLELPDGEELSFQGQGWYTTYNDNRDAVLDIVYGDES